MDDRVWLERLWLPICSLEWLYQKPLGLSDVDRGVIVEQEMNTCLETRREAYKIIEDLASTPEQVAAAQTILNQKLCDGCSNPLTATLALDDLMCDKRNQ